MRRVPSELGPVEGTLRRSPGPPMVVTEYNVPVADPLDTSGMGLCPESIVSSGRAEKAPGLGCKRVGCKSIDYGTVQWMAVATAVATVATPPC